MSGQPRVTIEIFQTLPHKRYGFNVIVLEQGLRRGAVHTVEDIARSKHEATKIGCQWAIDHGYSISSWGETA